MKSLQHPTSPLSEVSSWQSNDSNHSLISSFISKIREKFSSTNHELVRHLMILHHNKVIYREDTNSTLSPCVITSPALLTDQMFNESHVISPISSSSTPHQQANSQLSEQQQQLPCLSRIEWSDGCKFIITQRLSPSQNTIIATTMHQRQSMILSQIFSNCFLVLRFDRMHGVNMNKVLQDAISFIGDLLEL
ncbi:hypothetical protein C9374_005467 [Naegleria lovaniensis]|uniref:Uncharacterized protein n=1 Tax=Naegleria lovaniensis TaxID=51637 RepID=A0AA88KK46_NAELO|nr:uncharacterized protein C9374_005467 [Naegleria lovaniensis]KAG2382265.1 hypothetical protein C9374_005467 [Naegleria lovaniensis]